MEFVTNARIPVKSWCSPVEDAALKQAYDVANLPFAFRHVALMSDCHQGFGVPIGGVFAAKGVVVPFAVGKDIGCGVQSVVTNIQTKNISKDELQNIVDLIKERVPTGFKWHKDSQFPTPRGVKGGISSAEYEEACLQVGTLGGGNHFIELQENQDGVLCIMIHSGSRNIGSKVADHYHKIAVQYREMFCGDYPKNLSFLHMDIKEGNMYLQEMKWAVNFAKWNRTTMMSVCCEIIREVLDKNTCYTNPFDVAHNYASMEHHFGENVLVHRKGATRAYENEFGLIPGSQGTCSYKVKGLGNPQSFKSCSHGAGRILSRSEAKDQLDLHEEMEKMGDIIHNMTERGRLDEAVGAYKDIDVVMEQQKDLVEIVDCFKPLAVVKG